MDEQEPESGVSNRALSKVRARAAERQARADEKFRRRGLQRGDRLEDLKAKAELSQHRAEVRSARWERIKGIGARALRNFMIGGPILAPMSVAWTGQGAFAMNTLGWTFWGGVLYAAAYELTAVFCAWMYHEARKDGDKGIEYRLATWLFASGAAVQQWWHYSDDWSATPRSVTFSTMTMVGLMVWELYARLVHRRKLRDDGRIGGVRPRLGLARWVRYPRTSWTAWSLSILNGYTTLEESWTAAVKERTRQDKERTRRKDRADLKRPKTDPAPTPRTSDPIRREIEPTEDAVKVERTDLPGPRTDRRELTAGPEQTSPDLPAAPTGDRSDFDPTDLERRAVREMIERKIRLNRANVADYVRTELGGGIATKRAADLAAWGRQNGEGQLKSA